MKPLPIRLRLTLWYFVVFSCAGIILCFVSWFLVRRSLKAIALYEMGERIDDVRNILRAQPPDAPLDTLRRQFSEYNSRDDGKWLRILDQNGNWLFRSERIEAVQSTLPMLQMVPHQDRTIQFRYVSRHHFSHPGLALTRTISVHGRLYTVQTGLSQKTSVALLRLFAADLILLTPGLLLLAAFLGYWMSRKALSPIAELAQRARQISGQNLNARLPISNTKDEVSHLSETLNQMLSRIESGVRSMREFTANAAHELRTPLALIRTEVEVTLSLPRSNEEYCDSYVNVQQEAIRMTGLIDNLLMLARADAGAESPHYEVIDAAQVVRRVGHKWGAIMCQAFVEFHVETQDTPIPVLADSLSMQRLLNILLENACRYTPAGGLVTLSATAENGRVLVEVRDTGIGIPAEHLPRIFERFYRVNQARSRQLGGSGLGLSLAKSIADQHQGILTVSSELGTGTCVRFVIDGVQDLNGDWVSTIPKTSAVEIPA